MMKTMRLFFAAWPDEVARADLVAVRDAAACPGAYPVSTDKLHMTLLFLGEVAPQTLAALRAAAGEISCPSCEITLDYFWPGSKNKWNKRLILGALRTPPALRDLHDRLTALAQPYMVKPRRESEFRPHVTLWRKAREIQHLPSSPAVRFRVTGFSLVRSVLASSGSEYESLANYGQANATPIYGAQ